MKALSTFEREMQDTDFKQSFDEEYKEFLEKELEFDNNDNNI